jgi:hypothetical protein
MFNASLDANADVRRRLRIRATRPSPGDPICVSAASSVEKNTNANGVTTEWFWVGSVSLPMAARPIVEPLDESPYKCAGNPSTDAEIAQMFAPGQVAVRFQGASASNYLERSCHPVTGCTAYAKSYRSTRLVQVEVKGAGFQVRMDNVASGPTYPLTNGVFTVAAGDTGAVRGACIDERAAKIQAVGRYGMTSETLQLERRDR